MDDELLAAARAEIPQQPDWAAELRGEGFDWAAAARRLLDRSGDLALAASADDADQAARIADAYAEAFEALQLLRLLARAIASRHEAVYAPPERDPDAADWETEALRQIFWAGHLVSGEVHTLLQAGHPTGALARWRALHEMSIRAEVILEAGPDTARRYLDHEDLRTHQAIRLADSLARRSGADAILDPGERTAAAELAEQLAERHGEAFLGDQGWAHQHLLDSNPQYAKRYRAHKRDRGPTFGDLARTINAERLHTLAGDLYYDTASAAVHGAPRSTEDQDPPIAGEALRGPTTQRLSYVAAPTAVALTRLTQTYTDRDLDNPELDGLNTLLSALSGLAQEIWIESDPY